MGLGTCGLRRLKVDELETKHRTSVLKAQERAA